MTNIRFITKTSDSYIAIACFSIIQFEYKTAI